MSRSFSFGLWTILLATTHLCSNALAKPRFDHSPARAIPDEIIVKFVPGATAQQRASARASLGAQTRVVHDFGFIRAEHLELRGITVEQAIGRLRSNPKVEYAEPNYELKIDRTPDDPRFPELYAMDNNGQTGGTPGADIRATDAWDVFTGDPDLLLGVIDTGIDYTHTDLSANVWTNPGEVPGNLVDDDGNGYVDDVHGYDFVNGDGDPYDDHGHGSHVAGTIGAVGNNALGVVGVTWRIKIAGIKFLSARGSGTTADAIAGVQYAIAIGCRLTCNSWGGGGFSQALLDAIDAAGSAGQLFVAAAGNSGLDTDAVPHYPSSYGSPHIISVAATDHNDALAGFSNFGATSVDLGAPGVSILSLQPGGGYRSLNGTSMATPHVAGACALAWGLFPAASNLEIKQRVMDGTDPIGGLSGRCVTGGRLNVARALEGYETVPPGQITDLMTTSPGSTTMGLAWTATGDDGASGRARSYDLRYSASPITDPGSFASAIPVAGPSPAPSGASEAFEVGGLTYNTTYYFALRAIDDAANAGPISNVVTGTTLGVPNIAVSPGSLVEALPPGAQSAQMLQISNTGQGRLDWTAPTPEVLLQQSGLTVHSEAASTWKPLQLAKGQEAPRAGILGRGGPDAFGYRWVDSDEPGGPTFDWVEITGVGTPLDLIGDDVVSDPVPLGFGFPFYGGTFPSVRVCTNGFLSFTDGAAPYTNVPLPQSGAPRNLVAPFWDDLDFGFAQHVYTHNDGSRFVATWVDVPHFGGGGPYTFQAILYPNGEIFYQYLTLGAPQNSATAGIQDATGTVGLTVAYNASYFHDNLAVRIVPLEQWLSVSPASGRVAAGQSQSITVTFDATNLRGGIYNGNVRIFSNDPDGSPSVVPAQLIVGGVPDIAAAPDPVTFGSQFAGATYQRTLTVSNAGTGRLDVSGITTTGSCASALAATPTSFSLVPGTFRDVTVTWAPPGPCTLDATLTIASNDPDLPLLDVSVTGEAVGTPNVDVSPSSLTQTLPPAATATQALTIMNTGGGDLTWTLSVTVSAAVSASARTELPADREPAPASSTRTARGFDLGRDDPAARAAQSPLWLSASPQSGTIAPGGSMGVAVGFDSNGLTAGSYQGNLRLSSNDPDQAIIDVPVTLIVGEASCLVDAHEPDDTPAEAKPLPPGAPQSHTLCPDGDDDWYTFSLAEPAEVVLQTSGPSGDTRMWLFDGAMNEVEFNNDDGAGLFSHIDRICAIDHLPAGTYYVMVNEFVPEATPAARAGRDAARTPGLSGVPSYTMTLTVTVCECHVDPLEPDDSPLEANLLVPGVSPKHSLCFEWDDDWYRFTLSAPGAVTLETFGTTGDTRMWLFNENLMELGFDNDGGVGQFSRIKMSCEKDFLGPGTYYVMVNENVPELAPGEPAGRTSVTLAPRGVPSYFLKLTIEECDCLPDGYEPDDLPADAKPLPPGIPQGHSLCMLGDDDWYTFTLSSLSGVVLETSGSSGDTRMWLFDANLNEIEFDNDGGTGRF